ncbi:hypothetical protein [Psychrobacter phenylpyruvicus]|uniref:Uncharacterized protein n=1 Tax=Psychrobacter phenylpyruvicus TaxID=29432 RepID=A0A379LNN9_9GAMM|nr:hypothetical protein [Psychrobacter phenylpyruvicus]SUD92071.1 Uncharacterised protein [Psychrobacter phenylpyruvicus]
MFNYFTIEQAIKYVNNKVDYDFSFENLKDLETFQVIQPVFLFQGYAKFHYDETEAVTEIGGYFTLTETESLISKEDVRFEKCFLDQPALDNYDGYDGELDVCLNLEEKGEDNSDVISLYRWIRDSHVEINPYHYSFYLFHLDDDKSEVIKHKIKPHEVRIKKDELDDWLSSSSTDDNVQKLQARILELEQQLSQSSQQSDISTTEYTTPAIDALNAVVKKFWLDYDPKQKNATKQHTIKEWVKENYPIITDSMALWIDRIARHPSAK